MDAKFHPAIRAIKAGDVEGLSALLEQDRSLATARSSRSHPTLLQCLALEALDMPNKIDMAQLLVDAGAEINGPLGAAACIDNVEIAALLLNKGAAINGTGSWSPLEEALYWNNQRVIDLLLERGASLHNLRIASGLGRIDLIESFFSRDGTLKPEAGKIDWPFGELRKSNLNCEIKELEAKATQWSDDPQEIINNAFVYACMHGQIDATRLLLTKGAQINAIPPGFDYSGTGLHYAALNGHRGMVEFLIDQGANVNVKDSKVNSTAAGWADHGGHPELKQYLDQAAITRIIKGTLEKVGMQDLNNTEQLKQRLEQETQKLTLVALISPVCPLCRHGFADVQRVLTNVPDNRLRAHIVFLPMYPGDDKLRAQTRTEEFNDKRVTYYWDGDKVTGSEWQRVLGIDRTAWDVYLLYGPNTRWNGSTPAPVFWMHQLEGITKAPWLNKAGFESKIEEVLATLK